MATQVIFGLTGGLGLFIFGMKYLSEGLQKVAGVKLRRILRSLTQDRIRGVALGAVVTSVIQSSSATTVMLVGLINAGIVSLMQAASVVVGANIGTTVTAQIIAFKVSKFSLPIIGLGVLIMLVSRKRGTQFWGQVLFAFGLVFLGLSTMSGVMKPMKDIPMVVDFFVQLSQHPIMAILVGVVFTVLVQSSSASIGMVLALASTGLLDFTTSLYLILGDNIGTTITAWMASIGGSISAKRMACFHSVFNVVGAVYFAFLIHIGWFPQFIDTITPGAVTLDTVARHIANSHTFFNIFNAALFIIILKPAVVLVTKIIPGNDVYVDTDVKYLQDKLLKTPDVAIDSVKKELGLMTDMVQKTIHTAVDGFFAKDKKSIPHVQTQENAIDHIQKDMTYYIAKLSRQELSSDIARQLPPLLHALNDLERISDHGVNVAELTDKVASDDLVFSNNALAEMRTMYAKLDAMFEDTNRAITEGDSMSVERVKRYESELNEMQRTYLAGHSARLCKGKCDPLSALVFVDMVNNLEKMGDHLCNVAEASQEDFELRKPGK